MRFVSDDIWKSIRELEKSGTEIIAVRQSIELVPLISMKIARGLFKDLADVVRLIRHENLDDSFADRLHAALRNDYLRCLDEKRGDDEFDGGVAQ